jgi:glycosyltransferase involved in cell wall biosynthesis
LRGDRLTIHVGPFRLRRAARDGFRIERQFVAETLLRCRPDVVHAHWTYEYALWALAARLPTVIAAHDAPLVILRYNLPTARVGPLFAQVPTAVHWSVRTAMAALVARKATRLIAVSPYVEHHFRHALRYRGEITVSPDMVPSTSRRPLSPIERPPDEGIKFLTIHSSWSALKNGTAAIEAFAEIRAELSHAWLHMIGRGFGPGGPAESWAAERGLGAAGITFVGPLPHDRVLDSLATADILVHPSLEESFAMPIAEAQVAGVAVIGGAHSGAVPWTLDYNRADRLADVRSTSSLAGAMRELALDHATRSRLARAGADRARQRRDPERLITPIEALLDAAAHDHRAKTDRTV